MAEKLANIFYYDIIGEDSTGGLNGECFSRHWTLSGYCRKAVRDSVQSSKSKRRENASLDEANHSGGCLRAVRRHPSRSVARHSDQDRPRARQKTTQYREVSRHTTHRKFCSKRAREANTSTTLHALGDRGRITLDPPPSLYII